MFDFAEYTVPTYAHVIRGQGRVTGKQFAAAIRTQYECSDSTEDTRRNKMCADYVERGIATVEYTMGGRLSWTKRQ